MRGKLFSLSMHLSSIYVIALLSLGHFSSARQLHQSQSSTCVTPAGWTASCPNSRHARAHLNAGTKTVTWGAFTSSRWGNALSPYWQARAVAHLAGYKFVTGGFSEFWLSYLPKEVPAPPCPSPDLLAHACAQCDQASWEFTHRCAGAWPFIRPAIIEDTQKAFADWARDNNHPLPTYEEGDVVIQSRCASDTIISHGEYGPIGYSFYDLIPESTKTIYIVTELHSRSNVCALLHQAQLNHLRGKFPNANVTVVGGTPVEDFARLLYAPILFKDASSSFGLWAAMANKGTVYSTPIIWWHSKHNPSPFLGNNWFWVNTHVLYPSVASRLNLTADQPEAIIQWLKTN